MGNGDLRFKLDAATIGRRIRERRLERGESQEAVGKACGVSQNGIMKLERGLIENSRFTTLVWAHLGLDLAELSDLYRGGNERQLLLNDRIEVSAPRKAHLVKELFHEVVRMPGVGSESGVLITLTALNGAKISAVVDRAMVAEQVRQLLGCARELGIYKDLLQASDAEQSVE
jgi:transcriptional regulator with XRE-family HTH domain